MSQNPLHSYETHILIQINLLIAIKAVICDVYRNCSETNVLPSHDSTLLQNPLLRNTLHFNKFLGLFKVIINFNWYEHPACSIHMFIHFYVLLCLVRNQVWQSSIPGHNCTFWDLYVASYVFV